MQKTLMLAWLLASSVQAPNGPLTFTIDPDASQVVINVGRSGLFSAIGHTHEVAAPVLQGAVALDRSSPSQSTVRIEFDAAALRVTGKGEPAKDVPEVQRTMTSARVLDVSNFPRIAFESREIAVTRSDAGRLQVRITGGLTLHGVTRPESANVVVDVDGDRLTASGTLTVKQTDFGIRPVTAGAGTVRVKDAVEIRFTLVARAAR